MIAASCVLVVLLYSALHRVHLVAVALAAVTLVTVVARSLLSFRDLRVVTESSRRQALTDEMTGLGNRRHLMGTLEQFFAGAEAQSHDDRRLAMLLIDLDHFKEINDSFGHPVGDEILKMFGPRLQGMLRRSDVLARLGGDEFGILLTGADAAHATSLAERITTEVERPFVLDVASLHVSASIGIALYPEHARSSAELLRCADVAMYRAKSAHRPFDVYERAIDDGLSRMRRIEQLRDAIGQCTLELSFQPQFDLRTGQVPAVEALLRWPESGLGPEEFLPLAEEAGLMKPLTDLVLESALRHCAQWHASGHHAAVSVNLSTTNLLDGELPDRIRFLLARHRLEPRFLILEITETTLMADRERSRDVVQRLHNLGLTISIDDFGTGFSSLAYLSELAVGELKIDRSLIDQLDSGNSKNEAIVRTTIELGHSLGLRVVAEGVEDARTQELLASFGCDLAQGYFLARPQPAELLVFPSPAQPLTLGRLRVMEPRSASGRSVLISAAGGRPLAPSPMVGRLRCAWGTSRSTPRSASNCALSCANSDRPLLRCSKAGPPAISPPTSCCASAISWPGPASCSLVRSSGSPSGDA